ncbi:MAG: SRPBCC family protein [Bacteroidota bacterium]
MTTYLPLTIACFLVFQFIAVPALAQKTIDITTTASIHATPEEAFELLTSLKRFPEWSPFIVSDPNQQNHVTGTDGQVGAVFHWEGVDEKSKGQQTLVAATGGTYVRMECEIEVPFEASPVFTYQIDQSPNGIVVTQHFSLPCSGFQRFMMKLFGVPKQVAETNALGMARFKELLEQESAVAQR